MPFGRGWFGWGRGWGGGWGRGNPYPFCRFYPWLPRRWWAYGVGPYPPVPISPYGAGPYPTVPTAPYYPLRWYP